MSVSVAQFNILASNLGLPHHFPYVQPELLDWQHRHQTILKEIGQLKNPGSDEPVDVLALVELSNYWELFKDRLEERGYNSVFLKRPSITASSWSGVNKYDGCGIFFQRKKFDLVREFGVNFKDIHDRVALLVLLRIKQTNSHVIVVSTHLYWDSEKVTDQMKELKEVEEAISQMRADAEKEFGEKDMPIILTGDFNNGPNSSIYQHVTQSILEDGTPLFRSAYDIYGHLRAEGSADGQRDQRIVLGPGAAHGAELEAPFTGVNYKRCWTIDYIFYSHRVLRVTHLLQVPPLAGLQEEDGPPGWLERENEKLRKAFEERVLKQQAGLSGAGGPKLIDATRNNNGIPNSLFGSDHIPILAVFELLLV